MTRARATMCKMWDRDGARGTTTRLPPRVTREQRDDSAVHVRRRRRRRRHRRRASHSLAYAFLSSVGLAPVLVSVAPPREYGVLPTLRRRCIYVHTHHRVAHTPSRMENHPRAVSRLGSWLSPRRRASLSLLFSFSSVFAPFPPLSSFSFPLSRATLAFRPLGA